MNMKRSPNSATAATDRVPATGCHGVLPSCPTWYLLCRHAAWCTDPARMGWASGTAPPSRPLGALQAVRKNPFAVWTHRSANLSDNLGVPSDIVHPPYQRFHRWLVIALKGSPRVTHCPDHADPGVFTQGTGALPSVLSLRLPLRRACVDCCVLRLWGAWAPCAPRHVCQHVPVVFRSGRSSWIASQYRSACLLRFALT